MNVPFFIFCLNMKVNELYDEIYGFWSAIYPIIGFHLALVLTLKWINYPLPKISTYFGSADHPRKTKIKDFIETFHLGNVMPVFLIFIIIGYFALFNVAEGIYSSIRSIVPFFNININRIAEELNSMSRNAPALQNDTFQIADFGYLAKPEEASSRFLSKFYRWNFLMELAEFLVIFVMFLLLALFKKKHNHKLKLIKKGKVTLFIIISFVIMTFMRLKQEIFLYKAVKHNILVTQGQDLRKKDKLDKLIHKECKLVNLLEKKLNLDVGNMDEGVLNK